MADLDIPPARQLIDGSWTPAADGGELPVLDPATREPIQSVARGRATDVDLAVAAARRAFPAWAATSPSERGAILRRWADLIAAQVDTLADYEARDVGKPRSGGRLNMYIAQGIIDYFAGAADKLTGVTLPTRTPDFLGFTRPEPYGVCAVVIPWNVPAVLTAANVAPALAAGNTVVLKPSEVAPLSPFALAQLAHQAGLPPGVLNVVTGLGPEAGEALTGHPDIDHISFVGSTGTGRAVMRAAAQHLVPVKLELGGKSPNVVFADADLDVAIPAIIASITENAGQNCYAGSRLLVEEPIRAEVVERVAAGMAAVRLGPWDQDLDMGPLVSQAQYDRVRGFLAEAPAAGARLVTGGEAAAGQHGAGWYVTPTVFDQVDSGMRLAREEVFGPVLAVQGFRGPQEAVALMNDTDFGLLACVWTNDVSRALRVAGQARVGQVAVNQFHDVGVIGFPFNMQKDSGFSRGGGYAALREYTQEKAVAVRLLDRPAG
ncbi:aldehyde dehydrogenase family protein [Micromonospora endophytica]|uniref:Aldehyde dehydrogenase n=1 Tax=Micromonospora endophytica TaxID=515350 RepID=A0A2W2E3Q7_9ACTN|nr:aldehyde dehydrogenase family protein [Micromonospora endophytica]PZF99613.1 aldehyde dehydrogenase [Micromonospora endophytica]RIW43847.1 aldehyde dehydrogenase [Micromonospora endophytica]BCJ56983.1 aldehyde dehydrogenase [Micromonospora endophytica]